jgi:predicted lipoprotein with Yx(FWY)xxD motif
MSRLSHSWRPLLAIASLSLLAACSSYSTQQSRVDGPSNPMLATTYQTPVSSVMTGPTGMTLYTSDRDTAGRSNCVAECAQYWHPLIANQDSSPTANMTLITRDDGQRQWATADGSPLYTYVQDRAPGDVNGNNFQNDWHVVQQSEATRWSGAPTTTYPTPVSNVMTGPTGMTLYTFDRDTAGRSNCNGECTQYWHPLIANQDSSPTSNMTLITRDDGQRQWATADGSPLYTYVQDRVPGDVNGNNFQNDWHVIRQSQAAPWSGAPAIMTQTSAGSVLTTPTGMTLYISDRDTAGRSNCVAECAEYWHPLIANQDSSPTANMTLITRDDGQRQWATADGSPLYTYVQDRAPGDVNGNNFHNIWHVVL